MTLDPGQVRDQGQVPGGDSFRTLRDGGNRLVHIPRTSSWAIIKSSLQDEACRMHASAAKGTVFRNKNRSCNYAALISVL